MNDRQRNLPAGGEIRGFLTTRLMERLMCLCSSPVPGHGVPGPADQQGRLPEGLAGAAPRDHQADQTRDQLPALLPGPDAGAQGDHLHRDGVQGEEFFFNGPVLMEKGLKGDILHHQVGV